MTTNLHPSLEFSGNFCEQFRHWADLTVGITASYGIKTKPYHDPRLTDFSRLPTAEQTRAVSMLKTFYSSMAGAETAGIDLKDGRQALWHFLRRFGYRPCHNMFDQLENVDVLEIYDANEGIQIWRNFSFLRICSYTLEEMFCYPWQHRYTREDRYTQQILSAVSKVLDPMNRAPVLAQIEKHTLIEKFSESGLELLASHDKFFPLFAKSGDISGFLVTSNVEIVRENSWPLDQARDDRPKGGPCLSLVPN